MRIGIYCLLAFILGLLGNGVALAEAYPSKPVKIIVPFAAGSVTDGVARVVAEELSKSLGRQFIVENKPGASAIIGAEAAAKSPADGYVLLMTTNTSHAANPSLFKKLPYDPAKDFTPIVRIGLFPFVLIVNPVLPVKSVRELIAYSRSNPGKLSYATSNSASLVAAETIKVVAKIDMVGVPYKANPQALTDLMSGQVQLMIADVGTSRPHIKAGKLRAIGVTPRKRTPLMPDLPSLAEGGLPNFDLTGWVGMVGPAGMQKEVVAKLYAEVAKILSRKEVRERMAMIGCELAPGSPEEFADFIEQQISLWASRIKAAGIQPE